MTGKQVQSISLSIDNSSRDQKLRNTLQQHSMVFTASRPRSHSDSYKKKIIVSHEPIIELDENSGSRKTSFIKNPASRSNSVGSKAGRIIVDLGGYDNGGYMGKTSINNNFSRGYIDSARSSTIYDGLQVQREQYCCLSRWSPFERRLATSVGILALVIVALVIAVGFLASPEDRTLFLRP